MSAIGPGRVSLFTQPGPEAADRGCPRIGRDQGQTGRFMLGMSLSARDPKLTLANAPADPASGQWVSLILGSGRAGIEATPRAYYWV
jgi:hypothetical protein